MELHHRLRRDPNWHPSSCNICGQMGHQAAQCTVGTVNWRAMYGEDAFLMRPAIFQSDIEAVKKAKQIDFAELERKAKEYAKARREGTLPANGGGMPAMPSAAFAPPPLAAAAAGGSAPVARPPPTTNLPPGWAEAKDAQGKIYYWNRDTKAVQWDKPTLTPPGALAAPAANGMGAPHADPGSGAVPME